MAVNLSMRAESPASPDSPLLTAHDTSAGSLSADPDDSHRTTPGRGRKNKRKMSEPRRLSDLEKRPRVDEDDSGVETTSAGSADKSPVDEVDAPKLPGMSYPPAIMVPAYLPYGYPYLNPALHGGQYAMHMMNAAGVPGAALPAHLAAPGTSTTSSSGQPSTSVSAGRQAGTSSRQPGSSGTPVSGPSSEKPSRGRKSSEKDRDSSAFHKSGQGPRPPPVPVAGGSGGLAGGSGGLGGGSGGLGACGPPGPGAGIPGLAPDDPRQYKTMTVERRVEANARERTRVHTISAAFEALRRAVPAYSYNQKLSKLAILRIACCYILSLSRLADKDYSRDQSRPSFGECVDLTTRTIQAEGRAKKRH